MALAHDSEDLAGRAGFKYLGVAEAGFIVVSATSAVVYILLILITVKTVILWRGDNMIHGYALLQAGHSIMCAVQVAQMYYGIPQRVPQSDEAQAGSDRSAGASPCASNYIPRDTKLKQLRQATFGTTQPPALGPCLRLGSRRPAGPHAMRSHARTRRIS